MTWASSLEALENAREALEDLVGTLHYAAVAAIEEGDEWFGGLLIRRLYQNRRTARGDPIARGIFTTPRGICSKQVLIYLAPAAMRIEMLPAGNCERTGFAGRRRHSAATASKRGDIECNNRAQFFVCKEGLLSAKNLPKLTTRQ